MFIIVVLSSQQVGLLLQISTLKSHANILFLAKLPLLKIGNQSVLYIYKVRMLLEKKVHRGLKYSWRFKSDYWLLFTIGCFGFHVEENWLLKEKPKSLRMLGFGKEGENRHCLMICFHEMSALALKLQSWFDGKLQEAAHLWLTLPSNKKIDLRHNWVDADLIAQTHTRTHTKKLKISLRSAEARQCSILKLPLLLVITGFCYTGWLPIRNHMPISMDWE